MAQNMQVYDPDHLASSVCTSIAGFTVSIGVMGSMRSSPLITSAPFLFCGVLCGTIGKYVRADIHVV